MSTSSVQVRLTASTKPFAEAVTKARRAFEEFLEQVLADPIARAAFERAQKQALPVAGGRGHAYHQRARRRTRSRR